jgi:hypothetical protein
MALKTILLSKRSSKGHIFWASNKYNVTMISSCTSQSIVAIE